ncbi:unnamed protein product [Lactuca virosa]|uniref:TAFII55 protein conserved region domain-containing protein n=1 Tax=Lactuca virosa TaxID=75947 RepID=A0AAU9PQU7_9ASTR|nr:unnamed protein product [Lactuca virosa]
MDEEGYSEGFAWDSKTEGNRREVGGSPLPFFSVEQNLLGPIAMVGFFNWSMNTWSESCNLRRMKLYPQFLIINEPGMEEQFVLRVPPSVAERIDRLLNETASSSHDQSLNLSFSEDGRNGTFVIGDDQFPASLLDLPSIVESYKTYDDNVLIKTADIGQMIMIREDGDPAPDGMEYRHGVTPPMRDARRRRFRREPDLNPELVQRVEKDLLNIMNGGTAGNFDILLYHHQF